MEGIFQRSIVAAIFALDIREKIARAKYVQEDEIQGYLEATSRELEEDMRKLMNGEVED